MAGLLIDAIATQVAKVSIAKSDSQIIRWFWKRGKMMEKVGTGIHSSCGLHGVYELMYLFQIEVAKAACHKKKTDKKQKKIDKLQGQQKTIETKIAEYAAKTAFNTTAQM